MPRTGIKFKRGSNLSAGESAEGMAYLPDFSFAAAGFEAGDIAFSARDALYESPATWADGSAPYTVTPRSLDALATRKILREHWDAFVELQAAVESVFAAIDGSTPVALSRPQWAQPDYVEPTTPTGEGGDA